ncbi:MAG: hypothetical protein AAGI17_03100, partial [Planctomycetota bacterium]
MNRLAFESVRIDRLDGVPREQAFAIDGLRPGINIIHGPNGSGKTLTGRSMLALLWPSDTDLSHPVVAGIWTLDGEQWSAELEANRVVYRRDGTPVGPPTLPPSETRARHWLGLRELLATSGTSTADNDQFAAQIAREMLGGIDLDLAGRRLAFDRPPSGKTTLKKNWRTAQAELRAAHTADEAVSNDARQLAQLEHELGESRDAEREARILQSALEYQTVTNGLETLRAQREELPPVLQRLRDDDADRVKQLRSNLRESERRQADATRALDIARGTQADSRFVDGPPTDAAIASATAMLEELKDLAQRQRSCDESLAERRRGAEELEAQFTTQGNDRVPLEIDAVPMHELTQLAGLTAQHRAAAASRKEYEATLSSMDVDLTRNTDKLQNAVRVLTNWLALQDPTEHRQRSWSLPLLLACGLIVTLSVVLGTTIHVAWLGVILPTALFVYTARPRTHDVAAGPTRTFCQNEFASLGFPQPESWEPDAVLRHMSALQAERAEIERATLTQRDLTRSEASVAELERQIDDLRTSIASTCGFLLDLSPTDWLGQLGSQLTSLKNARIAADSLEAKAEELDRATDAALERFADHLRGHLPQIPTDASSAAASLHDLRNRLDAFNNAGRDIAAAQDIIDREDRSTERAESDLAEIFKRLQIEATEEPQLPSWTQQLGRFRELSKQIDIAEHQQNELRGRLTEHAELIDQHRDDLEHALDQARLRSERRDDLSNQIGGIRTRIDAAKNARSIEDAAAAADDAEATLRACFEETRSKAAGSALIEWLREEARDRKS